MNNDYENEIETAVIKCFIDFCETPELNKCKINRKVIDEICCLMIECPSVEVAEIIWRGKEICTIAAAEVKIADRILLFTKRRDLYASKQKFKFFKRLT